MPKTRTEIKAAVMGKLEATVDKALAEAEQAERPTLTDIEELVLTARAAVREQLTALMVETGSAAAVRGPRCTECGQEMRDKGQKQRYVRTRTGEVQIARAYDYCPACQRGIFPWMSSGAWTREG